MSGLMSPTVIIKVFGVPEGLESSNAGLTPILELEDTLRCACNVISELNVSEHDTFVFIPREQTPKHDHEVYIEVEFEGSFPLIAPDKRRVCFQFVANLLTQHAVHVLQQCSLRLCAVLTRVNCHAYKVSTQSRWIREQGFSWKPGSDVDPSRSVADW